MGPAGPTGPVMSREEVDRTLERLDAEYEAVESSLVALQDHAGRRLLEGAALIGVTARRWARSEEAVTLLWNGFDTYSRTLRTARETRERRRWPSRDDLVELTALLRGPVPVPGNAPSPAATSPPPDAPMVQDVTLSGLVERMNGWYAEVLDVVAAADSVWSALPARIDLLAAELERVRARAHAVGVRAGEHPSGDDLEQLTAELTALRAEVISDPLAFWTAAGSSSAPGGGSPDTSRYDRAARALEDVRRETDAVLDVQQDSERRLVQLRDLLTRADRTLAEARAARAEVLAKIAASEVPAVSGPPTALQQQLRMANEHRRHAQWQLLSPLLDDLEQRAGEELDRARTELSAVTAPLAVRAELRGRLDSYKAKAAAHRLGEDRLLAERYDVARRMLWSAPCDLRAAEDAVLRYQQAVQRQLTPGMQQAEQYGPAGQEAEQHGHELGPVEGSAVEESAVEESAAEQSAGERG